MKNFQFLRKKRVILMCGLPGSGKSTLAKCLAKILKARIISSDQVRKKVFKLVRFHFDADNFITKLRPKYYACMLKEIEKYLLKKEKIIVDATNMDIERINLINKITKFIDKKHILVLVVKTPKEIIYRRMAKNKNKLANEKEDLLTAWQRVYGYFEKYLAQKKYFWPEPKEGVEIIELNNDE
jgi:tRNA uridine 5-carbamoylmethylation protein Kti12